MKSYTIEVEETTGEFFEEVAGIIGKPVEAVMCDVLFIKAEKLREVIVNECSVNIDL